MDIHQQIQAYLDGPAALQQAIEGLSHQEIDSFPVPGTWSSRQVVCHLADAEVLYADRIKRIIAENEPVLFRGDPQSFLANLGVPMRNLDDELKLIVAIRSHIASILKTLRPEQFERRGIHSTDGSLTLGTVLERAAAHIPHHVAFIHEKRRAILTGQRAAPLT